MTRSYLRLLGLTGLLLQAWLLGAQTSERRHAITYKFLLHDYNSLDSRYQAGRSPARFFHPDDIKYGGELGYFRYLNPSFNVGIPLRIGGADSYINDSVRVRNQFFIGADLLGVYKFNNGYILKEESVLAPYLSTGMGYKYRTLGSDSSRGAFSDLQLPLALGLNIRLNPDLNIQVQAEYRLSLLERQDNLAVSAGFVWRVGRKKLKPEPKAKDRDGDGIPDSEDECPNQAGLPQFNGCPDKDGDGIPDHLDDCPDVAGLQVFRGCPDKDGDGTPDHLDTCPDEPGPKENKGCPVKPNIEPSDLDILRQAMENVQFETGSARLLPQSFAVLDKLADLLNRKPEAKLQIQGHTDNVGGSSANVVLSQNRAQACSDYLVSKGIAAKRLEAKGFGDKKPVATNVTPEGRAQNRRVEFILQP